MSKKRHKPEEIVAKLHKIENLAVQGQSVPVAAYGTPSLAHIKNAIAPADLLEHLDANFNYLLSSEWLSACSADFLESIKKDLSNSFNVQFIAVVRNPSDLLASSYLEGLKAGIYDCSVEVYVDEMISELRRVYRLILSLANSVNVINYDIHRDNLVKCFDDILFSRNISAIPSYQTVNPSPDSYQAMILRLANSLGLSNHVNARKYLEGYKGIRRQKFSLPHQVSARIYSELRDEIAQINELLRESEPLLPLMTDEIVDQVDLLTSHDIEFLSGQVRSYINFEKSADLNYIANLVDRDDHPNCADLPEGFNVVRYLAFNLDLIAARIDPIEHYLTHGYKERRRFK